VGAVPRFDTPDKTGWDIARAQVVAATPVARLVFLERPGGSEARAHAVPPANGVRLLAMHAVWLGDPDERGPQLFGPLLDLAHLVPGVGLRLPLDPSWLAGVPPVFADILLADIA
jgi:hypothetical protein